MTLKHPFGISTRLLPSVAIGRGAETVTVSLDKSGFVLDGPFGEHEVTMLRLSPMCDSMECAFETLLAFMEAASESFRYAERRGKDGMEGKNADLFPREVTEALAQVSDEIGMARFEIEQAIESGETLVEA
jgi:hypothetical protein